jgi:hypothetical protein
MTIKPKGEQDAASEIVSVGNVGGHGELGVHCSFNTRETKLMA